MAPNRDIPLGEHDETVLCAVTWRQSVVWVSCSICFLCALLVLPVIPGRGLLAPLMTSALLAACGGWAFLLGRSGLVLSKKEVQWREKWRTRHWGWDEIEGFDFTPTPDKRAGSVTLKSGEVVPFQLVVNVEIPKEKEKGRELIEELRRRLQYQREQASSG